MLLICNRTQYICGVNDKILNTYICTCMCICENYGICRWYIDHRLSLTYQMSPWNNQLMNVQHNLYYNDYESKYIPSHVMVGRKIKRVVFIGSMSKCGNYKMTKFGSINVLHR